MTAPAGNGPARGVSAASAAGAVVLEAREITRHFPAGRGAVVHAVEGVSVGLPSRGITAVVGESGCGKSTLARLFARLLKPTSGSLLLDGRPAPGGRGGRRRYSQQVQMVLQDPFASLNPVHDVRYHLTRPLKVHGLAAPGSLDEALAELLTRVALAPAAQFLGKYPHELSGGQRQRVAIARALAVRPRVLLADEPVSMLDVSIRLGILNLLADLRENDGMTILYITHDIASARYLADDIVVMYAGRVVESAPAITVTDEPAHPYTQLLLSAAPDPQRPEPVPLPGRGTVPSLLTPPGGCRFHPRCPHALAICSHTAPPPAEVAPGHVSACWLHAPDRAAAATHTESGSHPQRKEPDAPTSQLADRAPHPQADATRPTLRQPSFSRPRHGHIK